NAAYPCTGPAYVGSRLSPTVDGPAVVGSGDDDRNPLRYLATVLGEYPLNVAATTSESPKNNWVSTALASATVSPMTAANRRITAVISSPNPTAPSRDDVDRADGTNTFHPGPSPSAPGSSESSYQYGTSDSSESLSPDTSRPARVRARFDRSRAAPT